MTPLSKKGDVIQLQRRGYFICDSPYMPPSANSWKESPLILFHIPDGSAREMTPLSKKETKQANSSESKVASVASTTSGGDLSALDSQIKVQGDKVRELKLQKAEKAQVDAAVQELKSFKAAYKAAAGKEWSPAAATSPVAPSPVQKSLSTPDVNTLNSQIKVAGDKVRDLKTTKAEIDVAVKELLALKAEFKSVSGKDWSPNFVPTTSAAPTSSASNVDSLNSQIKAAGDKVRAAG